MQEDYAKVVNTGRLEGLNSPAKEQSGIPRELNAMEKNLAVLHDYISQLENRISPITRPMTASDNMQEKIRTQSSGIQSTLADFNDRLSACIRYVTNIIESVDL